MDHLFDQSASQPDDDADDDVNDAHNVDEDGVKIENLDLETPIEGTLHNA